MAEIKEPQKVLAFAGLIFARHFNPEPALAEFNELLGNLINKSDVIPFAHTTYYNKEMGTALLREWVLFEKLICPDLLGELKHKSNAIEQKYLNENRGRIINIDPGIVSMSNVILASTKNYSHRIYLGKGIYGEVTLIYKNHQFQPLKWTYPDYREETALKFFFRSPKTFKRAPAQRCSIRI